MKNGPCHPPPSASAQTQSLWEDKPFTKDLLTNNVELLVMQALGRFLGPQLVTEFPISTLNSSIWPSLPCPYNNTHSPLISSFSKFILYNLFSIHTA